ncbi:Ribosomal protein L32e [Candidatus Korarchaeum cryptofilum OPF8]|uniref:Ribosomal protein L32e n=2 Tax=Candidatus Korarchaeum cryptofilum TaxID=498846 RepID=B1L783_KORCO|nr:Ribosomal protein L32e [Candidatus Korarchaeum cryptofilum OPF8]
MLKLKKKKPRFLNLALYQKLGATKSWRRPRGLDNKQRLKLKSRPKQPNIGYKNPDEIRGLHPSGRRVAIVHNSEELRRLSSERESVIVYIAHTVGERKRSIIREEASKLGLKLAN